MAEARVVGVAVLADDRFDGRGVLEGEAVRDGRAVVEDVDGVAGDLQGEQAGADGGCEVVEVVFQVRGRLGQAEAGEVGGEDVVSVAEEGDEVSVLRARGWEAMEKQDGG